MRGPAINTDLDNLSSLLFKIKKGKDADLNILFELIRKKSVNENASSKADEILDYLAENLKIEIHSNPLLNQLLHLELPSYQRAINKYARTSDTENNLQDIVEDPTFRQFLQEELFLRYSEACQEEEMSEKILSSISFQNSIEAARRAKIKIKDNQGIDLLKGLQEKRFEKDWNNAIKEVIYDYTINRERTKIPNHISHQTANGRMRDLLQKFEVMEEFADNVIKLPDFDGFSRLHLVENNQTLCGIEKEKWVKTRRQLGRGFVLDRDYKEAEFNARQGEWHNKAFSRCKECNESAHNFKHKEDLAPPKRAYSVEEEEKIRETIFKEIEENYFDENKEWNKDTFKSLDRKLWTKALPLFTNLALQKMQTVPKEVFWKEVLNGHVLDNPPEPTEKEKEIIIQKFLSSSSGDRRRALLKQGSALLTKRGITLPYSVLQEKRPFVK